MEILPALPALSEGNASMICGFPSHYDVIKRKHFPRYWPFVWGIHRSPVNSPRKGQWRGALMFSLICARINGWVNNSEAGDLRRHRAHYEVTVIRKDMWRGAVVFFMLWKSHYIGQTVVPTVTWDTTALISCHCVFFRPARSSTGLMASPVSVWMGVMSPVPLVNLVVPTKVDSIR